MKKTGLLAIAFVGLVNSYAQQNLKGVVLDDSKRPFASASVSIEGSLATTFTNKNGKFEFGFSPKPGMHIVASFVGCFSDTVIVDKENIDKELVFNLKINPGTHNLAVTIRATPVSPFVSSVLMAKELKSINVGQDLPVLLNNQPSITTTSDAGAGIGYTGIRIRGSDASRINVSLNGIPVNDAESHGVFWVNMPDLANNIKSIQIQRGVGTSTNGSGAFGGALNIITDDEPSKAFMEASVSGGSFNTYKLSLKGTSGLLKNGFYFGGRTSVLRSEGFVDRAFSELGSYSLNAGWIHKRTAIKFLRMWGQEYTYQSWYGTPQSRVNNDKNELLAHYYRNIGVLYKTSADSANLFGSGRSYNYYQYGNETDNYTQSHNQIQWVQQLRSQSSIYLSVNYTAGEGYFEQFRFKDNLASYGIMPVIKGSDTFYNANLVRQRWLVNDFYAIAGGYNKQWNKISLTAGGGYFYYDGYHFGNVKNTEFAFVGNDKVYYDATGRKADANMYAKITIPSGKFLLFADIQYRYVNHTGKGKDNDQHSIDFDKTYRFFNPKAGITYTISPVISTYASVAIGQREPTRSDYTDRVSGPAAQPEKLTDFEAGISVVKSKFNLKFNAYFMDYVNQLVMTGKLNDVGTGLRRNVSSSYRAGLELVLDYQLNKHWTLGGNANLSSNVIKNFNEEIENYDSFTTDLISRGNTAISYSPGWISAINLQYKLSERLSLTLVHKVVSMQYLDNSGLFSRSLPGYHTLDFRANGTGIIKRLPGLDFSVVVNNVLNRMYSSNGYSYTYIYGTRITENYLYPQAGINFLAGITYKFDVRK